jgi:hypothetical protein
VPTVSELKERASSYEEHGQVDKALAIYDHILKHLEGQAAIASVVPLFVKVGDLRLRLNHSGDAVAAYERAAEHYAALGSSQRVTALCRKILGIQPGRLGVHAKFARQLMEHGHLGSATDVLAAFALDRQLDKAVEALAELEGRPDAEVKPMLESLLDSMDRGEPLKAEETARRVSRRLSIATDAIVGEIFDVQIETSSGEDVGTDEAVEDYRISVPMTPEAFDQGSTTGESATESEEEEGEEDAPPAVEAEKQPLSFTPRPPSDDATARPSAADREWKPFVAQPGSKSQKTGLSPAVLVGGGLLLGLLGGVGLSMAGVIPISFGNGSEAQLGSTPPGEQTDAPAPAPVPPVADPVVESTATAVPIMVEGLPIQSQVEVESQGRAGHIVVQLLDWADPITIESYLLPDDTTGASQAEPIRITVTPPDTVVGIMRFNGYQVSASGVMPEDSLLSLLNRLVVGR